MVVGCGKKMQSNQDQEKELKWSLEGRSYRSDLIKVYKMLHGKSVVNFNSFLKLDVLEDAHLN